MNTSTNDWNWTEILTFNLHNGGLYVGLGPTTIIFILFCAIAITVWHWKFSGRRCSKYRVIEAELNIANIGKVKLQPNDEIVRIAYQAWVELSTRKIGLPFDENHDVISEVYSSWYETFTRLRDLAKSIPARDIQNSRDTRFLVDLMVNVLNFGLRPHLTKWQAKFRRWYESECKSDQKSDTSPQEIQRRYPHYKELVNDLTNVQKQIVEYRDFLWKIASGNRVKGAAEPV